MQIKSIKRELKSFDDKQGLVQFYFASFNNKDSDGDIILPSAYKKTLEENRDRIRHFKNHDVTKPVGVVKDFMTDTQGVVVTSQLIKGSQLGQDTLAEYEAGAIQEHSQGFQIIDEEFSEIDGAFMIREVKLWEVSSLTHWGANSNTPVVGLKSERMLEMEMKRLKRKAAHHAKHGNDADLIKLHTQHQELMKLMSALHLTPEQSTQEQEAAKDDDSIEELFKFLNF